MRKENVYRFIIGQRRSVIHQEPAIRIKHPASDLSVPREFWNQVRVRSNVAPAKAASETDQAEVNVVYIPQGITGSATYILHSQGVGVIIDPGSRFKKIWAAVERIGIEIKYIVVTQAHADHMIALEELKRATGAQVAMHEYDKWAVSKQIYRDNFLMEYRQSYADIDIGLKDGDLLHFGGKTLEVIHTAGQTHGSICVNVDGYVFSGRLMFQVLEEGHGTLDVRSNDAQAYRKVIHRMNKSFMAYAAQGKPVFVEYAGQI